MAHFSDWGFLIFDNIQRLRRILHEEYLDSFSENVKKVFEEECSDYTKADYIICLSHYMQEILCLDYGLDPKKIYIIPNGLEDRTDFSVDPQLLRRKWHIGLDEKIILLAGRMDEVKGVNFLIRAFHQVLENYPNCRLLIAGNGDYNRYLQDAKTIYTKITFTGFLEKRNYTNYIR